MPANGPPDDVLRAAGVDVTHVERVGRGSRVWLITSEGSSFVLRRCSSGMAPWLHPVLAGLAARFPVPAPLPVFDGRSFVTHESGTWEAFALLPGHEIGLDSTPSLHDVGAFLGAFHETSLAMTGGVDARPGGAPLLRLRELFHSLKQPLRYAGPMSMLRRLVDRFAAGLEGIGYARLPSCVVHGDPATFNVLADGEPPCPSGLIDFELADREAAVADIAFCSWRSGRRVDHATELDRTRMRDFITGYNSMKPLDDGGHAAIPACLLGRGLQRLAKLMRSGLTDDATVERLLWIEQHQPDLITAI